jgi:hypothetical protein
MNRLKERNGLDGLFHGLGNGGFPVNTDTGRVPTRPAGSSHEPVLYTPKAPRAWTRHPGWNAESRVSDGSGPSAVIATERRTWCDTAMRVIELPWEDWRDIIDALRAKGLPYMRDHADVLERQLDQHAPDQSTVRLNLTDDVYLRSFNWARLQLGIPLPPEG